MLSTTNLTLNLETRPLLLAIVFWREHLVSLPTKEDPKSGTDETNKKKGRFISKSHRSFWRNPQGQGNFCGHVSGEVSAQTSRLTKVLSQNNKCFVVAYY